jgi:prolyl-tRNA synthetase
VEKGTVAMARRDKPGKEGKSFVPEAGLSRTVGLLLDEIQASLLTRATAFRDSHIHDPKDYDEFKEVVANGWAFSWWCGDHACEVKVKEDTKATTRCIPLEPEEGSGKCIVCGKDAKRKVYFSRAY